VPNRPIHAKIPLPRLLANGILSRWGIRFNGAKPGWWIGEKVSGGQDFNGDGLEDVLLTETSYPSGKETGASAYLVYGRSSDAFRRGDANDDGQLDVGDPIFILNFLFANGKRPACLDSADIDDSGDLTIGDPIYLLQYLYSGGPEPKEPFQAAGPDPTPDGLFCSG